MPCPIVPHKVLPRTSAMLPRWLTPPTGTQLFSPDGAFLCTLASNVEASNVAVSASGFLVAVSYRTNFAYRFDL